mgnify:FL=1
MTKQELLDKLDALAIKSEQDAEGPHIDADEALLDYIADEDIRAAYYKIDRWFA